MIIMQNAAALLLAVRLSKKKRGCLTKKRQLLFGAKKAFGL